MYLFEHTESGTHLIGEAKYKSEAGTEHAADNKLIGCAKHQESVSREPVAVMLDAENLPGRCCVAAMVKAQSMGLMPQGMAFANWQERFSKHKGSWSDIISRLKIQAIQVDRCPGKKNAVDIAIAAHAISLHEKDGLKNFFIVSNDGDYLYLVKLLRSKGCSVYGYGTTVANRHFRDSFNEFFCVT